MRSFQPWIIRSLPLVLGLALCSFFLHWPTAHCWPGDCIVNRGTFWEMLNSMPAFERIGGISILGSAFYAPLVATGMVAGFLLVSVEWLLRKHQARAQPSSIPDTAAPQPDATKPERRLP